MIDYDTLPLKKGQTRAEAKLLRDRLKARIERLENAKVKKRSGGQCEVVVENGIPAGHRAFTKRCPRTATQVHHMVGGHGKRAVGPSLLMEHKQHVCDRCHMWITGDIGGKKLKLIQFGDLPMYNDRYWKA